MTAGVAGGAKQRVHEVKYRRYPALQAYDYRNNQQQYSKWQTYLREWQPPMLVVWGNNDPFFTVAGAQAYRRDVPKAEVHLFDGRHFLLEKPAEAVAT